MTVNGIIGKRREKNRKTNQHKGMLTKRKFAVLKDYAIPVCCIVQDGSIIASFFFLL